jgi:hypothetical protein
MLPGTTIPRGQVQLLQWLTSAGNLIAANMARSSHRQLGAGRVRSARLQKNAMYR